MSAILTGPRYEMVLRESWKPRNHGPRLPWTFRESDVTADYTKRQLRQTHQDDVGDDPGSWTPEDEAVIWEMTLAFNAHGWKRFGVVGLARKLRRSSADILKFFRTLVESRSARFVTWDTVEIIE